MILLVLILGCVSDYGISAQCEDVGGYVVCAGPVTWDDATTACDMPDQPTTIEEQDALADAISASGVDMAWIGSSPYYDCPAMIGTGAVVPKECNTARGYVCQRS